MADNEFDWAEVSGQAHERLAVPKIPPVPEPIVRQAQRSYDGVQLHRGGKPVTDETGEPVITHNLRHEFPSEDVAQQFAKHIKNAGHHIMTSKGRGGSVSVVLDPDSDGTAPVNRKVVAWKAGERRGRAATV
jgi:hypothetical protein